MQSARPRARLRAARLRSMKRVVVVLPSCLMTDYCSASINLSQTLKETSRSNPWKSLSKHGPRRRVWRMKQLLLMIAAVAVEGCCSPATPQGQEAKDSNQTGEVKIFRGLTEKELNTGESDK